MQEIVCNNTLANSTTPPSSPQPSYSKSPKRMLLNAPADPVEPKHPKCLGRWPKVLSAGICLIIVEVILHIVDTMALLSKGWEEEEEEDPHLAPFRLPPPRRPPTAPPVTTPAVAPLMAIGTPLPFQPGGAAATAAAAPLASPIHHICCACTECARCQTCGVVCASSPLPGPRRTRNRGRSRRVGLLRAPHRRVNPQSQLTAAAASVDPSHRSRTSLSSLSSVDLAGPAEYPSHSHMSHTPIEEHPLQTGSQPDHPSATDPCRIHLSDHPPSTPSSTCSEMPASLPPLPTPPLPPTLLHPCQLPLICLQAPEVPPSGPQLEMVGSAQPQQGEAPGDSSRVAIDSEAAGPSPAQVPARASATL